MKMRKHFVCGHFIKSGSCIHGSALKHGHYWTLGCRLNGHGPHNHGHHRHGRHGHGPHGHGSHGHGPHCHRPHGHGIHGHAPHSHGHHGHGPHSHGRHGHGSHHDHKPHGYGTRESPKTCRQKHFWKSIGHPLYNRKNHCQRRQCTEEKQGCNIRNDANVHNKSPRPHSV